MSNLYKDFSWAQQVCYRYRNFKKIGDFSLRFSCPYCGDSKKNKKKARGNIYRSRNDLLKYNCFNCGIGPIHFSKFLQDNEPSMYEQYLLDIFDRPKTNTKPIAKKTPEPKKINKLDLDKATNNKLCLKYLLSRKIPKEHFGKFYYCDNFSKFVNETYGIEFTYIPEKDPRIVLKCESGENIIGLIGRSLDPNSKLRYINAKIDDSYESLIFGLNDIDVKKRVYGIEGSFDSLFINNSLAINSSSLTTISSIIPKNNLTLIWDNEPRNREICQLIKRAIDNNYSVVIWPNDIKGKDINEMILSGYSREYIYDVIEDNSFKGLEAELKFFNWCKV